jgi:hypothetical protein
VVHYKACVGDPSQAQVKHIVVSILVIESDITFKVLIIKCFVSILLSK